MLIYETDTQYILEHENIRIIAEKKDYPKDYEAYLKAELEKVLQNTQNAPQTMMVDGRVYEVQQPEQPRLTEQSKWTLIRQKRNRLLAECDWTQVPDAPLDEIRREAWQQYRQALREIPQRFERADDVAWPECPK
jgi:hypothetical protein